MATQTSFILSKSVPDLTQFKTAAAEQDPTTSHNDSGLYSSMGTLSASGIPDLTHDNLQASGAVDSEGYTPMASTEDDNTVYDEPVFLTPGAMEPLEGTATHEVTPAVPGRCVKRELDNIDAKPCDIDVSKIKETYDQPPVQKNNDEYDTVIEKSRTCCKSMPSIWPAFTMIALIVAVSGCAMSAYNTFTSNTTTPPLTLEDWNKIDENIARQVQKGIEQNQIVFDEKFAVISESMELERNATAQKIESLESKLAGLETTFQEYRNETDATIAQLSERASNSTEQIMALQEITNDTVTDLTELTEKHEVLKVDVSMQITSLETLANSTKMEFKTDLGSLRIEIRENQTALERHFKHKLHRLANTTATKLDELSLQQSLTQGQVDIVQNSTYQLEERQHQTVTELETLNDTVNGLDARITVLNSTLMEEQELLASEFTEQITTLKAFLNLTEMQIKNDLESLSTEIQENLTTLESSLETRLYEFAISTHNNFSATENLILAVGNKSASSINEVRYELSYQVNTTQTVLASLRENITTRFETLSTSLERAKNDFLSRIRTSKELITTLATEARLNHTRLTSTVTNNNQILTTRFDDLGSKLGEDIDQVTTEINDVSAISSSNERGLEDLKQDVEPLLDRTKILESGQRSISDDVVELDDKVRSYHSSGVTLLSNTITITTLTVIALLYSC